VLLTPAQRGLPTSTALSEIGKQFLQKYLCLLLKGGTERFIISFITLKTKERNGMSQPAGQTKTK
jgi:hypothetical protein